MIPESTPFVLTDQDGTTHEVNAKDAGGRIDLFAVFPDRDAMLTECSAYGFGAWQEDVWQWSKGVHASEIGLFCTSPAAYAEEGETVVTPAEYADGWHVNFRLARPFLDVRQITKVATDEAPAEHGERQHVRALIAWTDAGHLVLPDTPSRSFG